MKGLARSSYLFSKSSVGAERIAEVMSVQSEVTDREGGFVLLRLGSDIEFRDVAFGYETGRMVRSHINLRIAPRRVSTLLRQVRKEFSDFFV